MSRVRVTLRYMVGEGLSPGSECDYVIPNDDEETVVTEVIHVGQGKFAFRRHEKGIEGDNNVNRRVLARISKQNVEPTTLSLLLEPLADGVFVELPISESARPYDSDRVSVLPSSGIEKHYVHLSPDETINFSREGLKVAIMAAEIPNSSTEPSSAAAIAKDVGVTNGTEGVHPEVQVKSSNVEPEAAAGMDEDEETDSSDGDGLDATDLSTKTPAVPDLTPATFRPTEQTIMETPHDDGLANDDTNQLQTNNDGFPPDVHDSSPTIQATLAAKSRRLVKDRLLSPNDPEITDMLDGIASSDFDDDLEKPARKVGKTYSKQQRKVQGGFHKAQTNAASPMVSDKDGPEEEYAGTIADGEEESLPVIEDTSDPLTEAGAAHEAAVRNVRKDRPKRKVPDAIEEESVSPASKKRRTTRLPVVSDDEEMGAGDGQDDAGVAMTDAEDEQAHAKAPEDHGDAEEEDVDLNGDESDAEDEEDDVQDDQADVNDEQADSDDEDAIEVAKPTTKAKTGKTVAPRSSGRSNSSAIVVIPTQRARKNLRTVSKTPPSSSAASSAITGKVPKILLSKESALRKSAAKWLHEQNAPVIDDVRSRRTHFVCVLKDDKLTTTAKVLRSLALGKLVVTEEWIKKSKKAGQLLEPDDFVVKDLKVTITLDRRSIFQGKNLFFTNALVDAYGDGWKSIQALAKEAGASQVNKGDSATFGKLKGSIDTVCFGRDKEDVDVKRLAQSHGCAVYHKDLLTQSILLGELDLDDEEFKLSAGGSKKKR